MPISSRDVQSVCTIFVLLVLTSAGARAQDTTVRRARSAVLLQPPISAIARERVQRPPVAPPPSEAPAIATQPAAASALVRAAKVQDSNVETPLQAATSIAGTLYGTRVRSGTVTVLNNNAAIVWVGDSAVMEKAPPGLNVEEGVVLPFRYIMTDEQTGEIIALKPWLDAGGGLRYDSRRRAYVATLSIMLRDTLSAITRRRVLSPAIHLSMSSSADSVQPSGVQISETNVIATTSRLVSSRLRNPMQVTLWPDFAAQGVDFWVPVVPDFVRVSVDDSTITGFGLEVANVTVRVSLGALAPGDSIAVTLKSDKGSFLPGNTVWTKADAPATVQLRGKGLGRDSITALAEPFEVEGAAIHYQFPSGLVGGSMFGALIGSALAVMRERKRVLRRSLNVFFASGLLTGMVLALVVAVGVLKIPGFELAAGGTALVSLLAGVLGGYVGPKGLESLAAPFKSGRATPPKAT